MYEFEHVKSSVPYWFKSKGGKVLVSRRKMLFWLFCALISGCGAVGLTDGAGDVSMSVRIDFGNDNSKCGPNPICDAANASCLADDPPRLQLQLCESGFVTVEYVTTASEQISNYYQNSNCEGNPMSSETVAQGECKARGGNEQEARQYFPLVGVCNNGSKAGFVKHYISWTQPYSSSSTEYPTDVCLGYGQGEAYVFTLHDAKVFRATFGTSACDGTPSDVSEMSSAVASQVVCLDFASVGIDWNMDGTANNDGRDVSAHVVTTTSTTTTAMVAATSTTTTAMVADTTTTTTLTMGSTEAGGALNGTNTTADPGSISRAALPMAGCAVFSLLAPAMA